MRVMSFLSPDKKNKNLKGAKGLSVGLMNSNKKKKSIVVHNFNQEETNLKLLHE